MFRGVRAVRVITFIGTVIRSIIDSLEAEDSSKTLEQIRVHEHIRVYVHECAQVSECVIKTQG